MQTRRPYECPACGHDRVAQRPHALHTETGQLRVRVTKWACGLCSYQWTLPSRTVLAEDWERT